MNRPHWWVVCFVVAGGLLISCVASLRADSAQLHDSAQDEQERSDEQGKPLLTAGRHQEAAPKSRLSQWHTEQALGYVRKQVSLQALALAHAERALELDPMNQQAQELIRQAWNPLAIEPPVVQEYRVTSGDVLEVSVWHKANPLGAQPQEDKEEKAYRVSPGDILEIFVWQQPDLSRDVIIRPDGRLSFPLAGDIQAEGLTLTQLDVVLTGRLTTYLRQPDISLALKRLATTGTTGATTSSFGEEVSQLSRDVIIRPDGRLSFPLVGDIQAEGLTLTQLDVVLTERLNTYFRQPDISLALKRFGGTKTIVLGEVGRPGVYALAGQGRVLEMIAMAGGFTKDAGKKTVMLIRGGLAAPQVSKLNLEDALSRGALEENAILEPNDILFVPKGKIASTFEFMERFFPTISEILVGQSIATNFGIRETSGGISR